MNTIIQAVFCLCLVTTVHEAGHYIAAKLYGVQVTAISIFYGTLIKFSIAETKIMIGIIPMGGFTLIPGIHQLSKNKQRIIAAAGIIFNLLTFILILFLKNDYMRPAGILSCVIACINLLPVDPFDGKLIFK